MFSVEREPGKSEERTNRGIRLTVDIDSAGKQLGTTYSVWHGAGTQEKLAK